MTADTEANNVHEANRTSDKVELFVSGRLCLFGEHSDWAGEHRKTNTSVQPGRTIVCGTQEGLHATAKRLETKVLRMAATVEDGTRLGPIELPLEPEVLLAEARAGGYWSYVAGTAYYLIVHFDIVGGLEIDNHRTTLPMGKGLSSSAAVCVLVARSFNTLFGLHLSTRGEMEMAYQGEVATPSKCGRMDQACAFGSVPVRMTFAGDILHVEPITLTVPLYLVLVDLGAAKCTTTILTQLQEQYPTATCAAGKQLHQLLGPINLDITSAALEAMSAGDVQGLGRLMNRAQQEFYAKAGPVCPSQLSAPVLHATLAHQGLEGLVLGGKGVGSQGDGAAQFLCVSREAQQQVCVLLQGEGMHCMPLTIAPTTGRQAALHAGIGGAVAVQNGVSVSSLDGSPKQQNGFSYGKMHGSHHHHHHHQQQQQQQPQQLQ